MYFGDRVCAPVGKEEAPDSMPGELVLLVEQGEKALGKLCVPTNSLCRSFKTCEARLGARCECPKPDLMAGGDPDARAVGTWPL